MGWPIISCAVQPKMRSAAGFHAVTMPSRVFSTTASSEEARNAASSAPDLPASGACDPALPELSNSLTPTCECDSLRLFPQPAGFGHRSAMARRTGQLLRVRLVERHTLG